MVWAAPSNAAAPNRSITISATGVVKVTPDAVRLNMVVTVVSQTSATALSNTSIAASLVRAALKTSGIESKDIKTKSLSLNPEYSYTQDKGQVLIGYRGSQSFDVVIRKASNAGAIVDAVVVAGGDAVQINGATPIVLDTVKATASARIEAVKNAKSKAAAYAQLLSVKLGKVTYLVENSSPNYPGPVFSMEKAASSATEIDLGQQEVTVSITVRWALL